MDQRLSQKRADPVEELRPEVTLARRIVELLGNPSAIALQVQLPVTSVLRSVLLEKDSVEVHELLAKLVIFLQLVRRP
jgi:hypothetical protein